MPPNKSLGRGTQEPSGEELENEDPDLNSTCPPIVCRCLPGTRQTQLEAGGQGSPLMPPMEFSLWVQRRMEKHELGLEHQEEMFP